jgi:endo-1,4-beta-D-glucanase Y
MDPNQFKRLVRAVSHLFDNNAPSPLPVALTFEDHNSACFIVKDANGLGVAYVYYEEEPGRRAAANLMTKDEARRIAANIAKLPGLLLKSPLGA